MQQKNLIQKEHSNNFNNYQEIQNTLKLKNELKQGGQEEEKKSSSIFNRSMKI
ncbi:unnamed protein product [Paramecium sonneborni]|uniref:Uncharacterized protein n=1 Tax=Paramecium sonneborni TaxID=65129 RepID=A0A8S1LHW3_9CILI|nr:unnamed protein product [Paramecium sonneborni]